MKQLLILAAVVVAFSSVSEAAVKPVKFWVRGDCTTCKTRIEKTANAIPGASGAVWNVKTKMLAVNIDPTKTSQPVIEKSLAKVGHATKSEKADQKAYDALPACCRETK
jgi:cation transport ATPase